MAGTVLISITGTGQELNP